MENKYSALLELRQNLDITTRLAYRSSILSYLCVFWCRTLSSGKLGVGARQRVKGYMA